MMQETAIKKHFEHFEHFVERLEFFEHDDGVKFNRLLELVKELERESDSKLQEILDIIADYRPKDGGESLPENDKLEVIRKVGIKSQIRECCSSIIGERGSVVQVLTNRQGIESFFNNHFSGIQAIMQAYYHEDLKDAHFKTLCEIVNEIQHTNEQYESSSSSCSSCSSSSDDESDDEEDETAATVLDETPAAVAASDDRLHAAAVAEAAAAEAAALALAAEAKAAALVAEAAAAPAAEEQCVGANKKQNPFADFGVGLGMLVAGLAAVVSTYVASLYVPGLQMPLIVFSTVPAPGFAVVSAIVLLLALSACVHLWQ
jgi:hypothetical protein